MKNSKKTFQVALLLVAIVFASCRGHVDRDWSVENLSSQEIHIKAILTGSADTIYKDVAIDEDKLITITMEDRDNQDPQLPYDVFTYLQITNDSGDVAQIEWMVNTNWDIYIEQTGSRPSSYQHWYKLIVEDKDF